MSRIVARLVRAARATPATPAVEVRARMRAAIAARVRALADAADAESDAGVRGHADLRG